MNTPEFKTKEFQSFIDEVLQNKVDYRIVEDRSQYFKSVYIPQLKCNYSNNEWIEFDNIINIVNIYEISRIILPNHVEEKYNDDTEELEKINEISLNADTLLNAKLIISDLKNNIHKLKIKKIIYDYNDMGNLRNEFEIEVISDNYNELSLQTATSTNLDIPELD